LPESTGENHKEAAPLFLRQTGEGHKEELFGKAIPGFFIESFPFMDYNA
jgi:hypothetical protein